MAAAASRDPALRPRSRVVLHPSAFVVSVVAGVALAARSARARWRCRCLRSATRPFGAGALYHRVEWRRLGALRWICRLDDTMTFVLISGSYTPFGLLVLHGTLGAAILITAGAVALVGAVFKRIFDRRVGLADRDQ